MADDTPQRQQRFVKQRMQSIAEAKRDGNHARAERLAEELLQYLGVGESELPIEDQLEPLE